MEAIVNVFLRKKFKTSRVKILAKLAISRAQILWKQRQVRYSHAKSDVIELLKLGYQERALLRVEHVMKEQNMMDAFAMIMDYCSLLIDRVMLLKKNKECPEELKEAISSLIFASSRCGEFPELQKIRGIFVSRFGREFAAHAIELRNNSGVNPKIIQKLSTQWPSLDSRSEVLKDIASENGIILNMEEDEEKFEDDELSEDENDVLPKDLKTRKKYRDVAAAALEAFESAAYAAAAARAAVELSRPKYEDTDR
ncbi:IST1 homolog [Manihot esculenta]|uniref:IST1-like protein n=1 Tax=Manihot esculenta TaxID=3983 RepID=A0A2C9WKZ2_MANES|nr:IST1 homolog [Manihot esculenta]OAY60402.1 hypothetical protein MANES_01G109500v8 [Manihot esculenta]